MSTHLDLNDCAAQSELAVKELAALRARIKELEDLVLEASNCNDFGFSLTTIWKDRARKALNG